MAQPQGCCSVEHHIWMPNLEIGCTEIRQPSNTHPHMSMCFPINRTERKVTQLHIIKLRAVHGPPKLKHWDPDAIYVMMLNLHKHICEGQDEIIAHIVPMLRLSQICCLYVTTTSFCAPHVCRKYLIPNKINTKCLNVKGQAVRAAQGALSQWSKVERPMLILWPTLNPYLHPPPNCQHSTTFNRCMACMAWAHGVTVFGVISGATFYRASTIYFNGKDTTSTLSRVVSRWA